MKRMKLRRVGLSSATTTATIAGDTVVAKPEIHNRNIKEEDEESDNGTSNSSSTEDEDVKLQENRFVDACIDALTPTDGSSSSSNNNMEVSQVQFASFVIKYCRDDDNAMIRGVQCTNALFFFPDLPNALQMEFVRYTLCSSEIVLSTEDNDMTIEDCLNEYNANGNVFYMEDSTLVPELCTVIYPLMTSTDLLLDADAIPITPSPSTLVPTTPIPTLSVPTIAPSNVISTQIPTTMNIPTVTDIDTDTGLSNVGMLGITITILFAIMCCYQSILWKCRKRRQSSKQQEQQNDNMELYEDESFVASEHSHELANTTTTPTSTFDDDGGDNRRKDDDSVVRPTLDSPLDVIAGTRTGPRKSWLLRTPKNTTTTTNTNRAGRPIPASTTTRGYGNRSKSPHQRYFGARTTDKGSGDEGVKFTYPSPLVVGTENLSDSNPVHTRKRFQGKKATGHFPFDEDGHKTGGTTTTERNETTTGSSTERNSTTKKYQTDVPFVPPTNSKALTVFTNGKASEIPITSTQQPDPPRPIVSQQSGKENSNNTRSAHHRNKSRQQPTKKNTQIITAITFGDVIHTELQRDTTDATTRIGGLSSSASSTILRQPQRQLSRITSDRRDEV